MFCLARFSAMFTTFSDRLTADERHCDNVIRQLMKSEEWHSLKHAMDDIIFEFLVILLFAPIKCYMYYYFVVGNNSNVILLFQRLRYCDTMELPTHDVVLEGCILPGCRKHCRIETSSGMIIPGGGCLSNSRHLS